MLKNTNKIYLEIKNTLKKRDRVKKKLRICLNISADSPSSVE